jgi:hypothetical protein
MSTTRRREGSLPARAVHKVAHLVKRFAWAITSKPPTSAQRAWAHSFLLPGEATLWDAMTVPDQHHSLMVTRRFVEQRGEGDREAMAAALLHDVGKLRCGLGTFGRVAATLVGPHGRRFRLYHDHERIGADMLRAAGSAPRTADLVAEVCDDEPVALALFRADDM